MAWYQFVPNESELTPGSRECHTLDAIGTHLILFGGNDRANRVNDVFDLDTSTNPDRSRAPRAPTRDPSATLPPALGQ